MLQAGRADPGRARDLKTIKKTIKRTNRAGQCRAGMERLLERLLERVPFERSFSSVPNDSQMC